MSNSTIITDREDAKDFLDTHLTHKMMRPLMLAALDNENPNKTEKATEVIEAIFEVMEAIVAKYAGSVRELHEDKIDGLGADLFNAVQTAYNRGAVEWAKLNYPSWIPTLEANLKLLTDGNELQISPLDWTAETGGRMWKSDRYRIEECEGGGYAARVWDGVYKTLCFGLPFDEAVAVAQADHEDRIKTAIHPTISTQPKR